MNFYDLICKVINESTPKELIGYGLTVLTAIFGFWKFIILNFYRKYFPSNTVKLNSVEKTHYIRLIQRRINILEKFRPFLVRSIYLNIPYGRLNRHKIFLKDSLNNQSLNETTKNKIKNVLTNLDDAQSLLEKSLSFSDVSKPFNKDSDFIVRIEKVKRARELFIEIEKELDDVSRKCKFVNKCWTNGLESWSRGTWGFLILTYGCDAALILLNQCLEIKKDSKSAQAFYDKYTQELQNVFFLQDFFLPPLPYLLFKSTFYHDKFLRDYQASCHFLDFIGRRMLNGHFGVEGLDWVTSIDPRIDLYSLITSQATNK